jgi:hypothetical protein
VLQKVFLYLGEAGNRLRRGNARRIENIEIFGAGPAIRKDVRKLEELDRPGIARRPMLFQADPIREGRRAIEGRQRTRAGKAAFLISKEKL